MKRFSGVLQFTLGFFLGLLIFVGGVSLVGYLVFSRLAATPPRPVFPEENKTVVKPKPTVKPTTTATKDDQKTDQTQTGETTTTEEKPKTEEAKASPSPERSAMPSPEDKKEELPAGAYQAKVIWSGGLSLRANPDKTSERVGGVDYNDALVVLEKSSDGEWVKVKVPDSDQVGWVRVGNIKKTD